MKKDQNCDLGNVQTSGKKCIIYVRAGRGVGVTTR